MGVNFLEDNNGNKSTMRLLAIWGAIAGTYLIVCGSIAMFMNLPAATPAMTSGVGLFSLGELAKAFQAQKGL